MVFIKLNNMENWKDIPGYEGLYQISNFGNVKSLISNRLVMEVFNPINTFMQVN